MRFRFLEDVLGFLPNFRFLERNSQRYSVLLYQHSDSLVATNERIGNLSLNANQKLTSFFQLAKQTNADLVLTPEYCCPISNIKAIVQNPNAWPSDRKLWVIGSESISKVQMAQFREEFSSENVFIFFEDGLLDSGNNFFDPLIYCFVSNDQENKRLNIIIQFKTYHMSVWSGGAVERNNIIVGNDVYIFRNDVNSIHFFSLICSEAMNFSAVMDNHNITQLRWLDSPYLIFNPQLNGEPTHTHFTAFRRFAMQRPHREIIQLNWSMKSKVGNNDLIPVGTSRSGFIINSSEINLSDYDRIRSNHSKGLYYFNFAITNKHAYLCNSYIDAFLIHLPSVDISNVLPQQARRDGPEVLNFYCFDGAFNLSNSINAASDSSLEYMNSLACNNAFLRQPKGCVIEKERLACLTAGEVNKGISEWAGLSNLFSFRIDENTEINRRFTFAEDTIADSVSQRRKYVNAIISLEDILTNKKHLFPDSISSLRSLNLIVAYHQKTDEHGKKIISIEKYKYNITTTDGIPIKATVCFLDYPTEQELNAKFDILQGLFDDNPQKGRVVIFYTKGFDTLVKADPSAGKFTSGFEYNGPSYLNTDK
jgi:hypothetical protein